MDSYNVIANQPVVIDNVSCLSWDANSLSALDQASIGIEGNWNFRTKELSFPGTKVP